jgi:hypothetical protein
MNSEDFLKQLNAKDDQRASALAELRARLKYVDIAGHTMAPGDADYDPMLGSFVHQGLARELNDALMTGNSDGLNSLLDRWWSANSTRIEQSDVSQMQKKIGKLCELVSWVIESQQPPIKTTEELTKRISPRGVGLGAVDSRGLLR